MKKSIWIFLLAVLLPGGVLGWLALRSAGEQQIIFERRTAELYQKETEDLASAVRDTVEMERRAFSDVVHRLLGKSDATELARDFTNTLADAWQRKAIGFAIGPDGNMLSPSASLAAKDASCQDFLWNNGSFLCSTQRAVVYPVPLSNVSNDYSIQLRQRAQTLMDANQMPGQQVQLQQQIAVAQTPAQKAESETRPALVVKKEGNDLVLVQKNKADINPPEGRKYAKQALPPPSAAAPASDFAQKKVEAAVQEEGSKPTMPTDKPAAPDDESAGKSDPAGILRRGGPPTPAKPIAQEKAQDAIDRQRPKPAASGVVQSMPAPGAPPAPAPASPVRAEPRPAPAGDAPTPAEPIAPSTPRPTRSVASANTADMTKAKPHSPFDDVTFGSPPAPELDLGKQDRAGENQSPTTNNGNGLTVGRDMRNSPDAANAAPRRTFGGPAGGGGGISRTGETTGQVGAQSASQMAEMPDAPHKLDLGSLNASNANNGIPAELFQNGGAFNAGGAGNDNGTFLFNRQVTPSQDPRTRAVNWSAVVPATADFAALTAHADEGMVTRFVQDKLGLIFWIRPPEAPEIVFGCLIEVANFGDMWSTLVGVHPENGTNDGKPGFILALLDDKARPVSTFPRTDATRDWKRPFVASEIGEALPHWETALYLATPTALADSARGFRRTLSFTIVAAIALIALGGWLVVADVRRQLALAQKKTDFVSNVSHELKTPLTSIRMFAELMHDRPPPAEKQGQYLRIITAEAERLTRLINNVLDFAKLERRQKRFEKCSLNLHAVICRVWEGHEMHLRDSGFTTKWEGAPGPYPVTGDEDALAQILVNLLSNAEKYSSERKEVELVTWIEDGHVNVSVLDRGIGVPDGEERKIFESFYRAHDSLSSGIQGSGLGLTLAQRLAREHDGGIVFERRKDGGSRFTLRLPISGGTSDE